MKQVMIVSIINVWKVIRKYMYPPISTPDTVPHALELDPFNHRRFQKNKKLKLFLTCKMLIRLHTEKYQA